MVNDFDALYTWDNQGRMTARNGPDANYAYTYDSMGRLSTMTQAGNTIASAQYGAASQLTSLTYDTFIETRNYNSLLQLIHQTTSGVGGTVMDMQYVYSATQNNGRIVQSIDGVVGETVNYTYDPLNRLSTAGSTGGWGQQYTYDGFGNLTGMQGAAVWSYPVNSPPAGSDANGLAGGGGANSWNVENRLVAGPGINSGTNFYGYDPYGKRVFQAYMPPTGSTTPLAQAFFNTLDGRKVASIQCTATINPDETTSLQGCALSGGASVYFAGKLIRSNGVTVATDRLGSVRGNANGERMSYLPYGQERTSTADGREKFGTYFRDGAGQDYADQRYYNPQMGTFWSPDPGGMKTADPTNPGSWNRSAYVQGDPVNFNDPTGKELVDCLDDWGCDWFGDGGGGGGGGGWNPCYGDQFNPVPDPFCYAPVPLPPPEPPSKLLPFECEADLYYRPVDDFRAKLVGATHSYWEIQEYDPNSQSDIFDEVISGGPSPVKDPKTGKTTTYLNVWVHSPYSGPDQPTTGTEAFPSGLSTMNCAGVSSMRTAAKIWPPNTIVYGFQTWPNSNTVAHALGQLGGFNPSPPPGSWGWNP